MADKPPRRPTLSDDWLTPEIAETLTQEERALALRLGQEVGRMLDPRDLRRRGGGGIAELVLHALGLLRTLRPDEIRVRVESPGGHRAGRTAVEVVTPDCPFLLDTLRMNLRRLGHREMLMLHPLLPVERNPDGTLLRVPKEGQEAPLDCYLYAEIPRLRDPERCAQLERELLHVYGQVRTLVGDHGRMVEVLRGHVSNLGCAAPHLRGGTPRAQRLTEFLDWIANDNYIFFGYRHYSVGRDGEEWLVQADSGSGLGILHDVNLSRFREPRAGGELPSVIRTRLADDRLVFFDKSRTDSMIHRAGKLDCIRVKTLDEKGQVVGFGQFVGLLTYSAIRSRGSEIAILLERRKQLLSELGHEPGSYTYKLAEQAYDSLPIEALFQFDLSDVKHAVDRIVNAIESSGLGVYLLPDPLSRSFFISVILPRSRYDEELRIDLEKLLCTKYGATYTDNRVTFLDDEVALIHFFCSGSEEIDVEALQQVQLEVESRVVRWEEGLEAALLERCPEERAYALVDEYRAAFPERYQVVTPGRIAVHDVEALERLRSGSQGVELDLRQEEGDLWRLNAYQRERPYLTDLLPTLDHFGLRVVDATLTEIAPAANDPLWIVTFRLEEPTILDGGLKKRLLHSLTRTFSAEAGDDVLNRLVLRVGLDWREVELLRAFVAYAHQIGSPLGKRFACDVLTAHPDATRALIHRFRVRFDPDLSGPRDKAEEEALAALECARVEIPGAAEDRVFGLLGNLVESSVRTSYFAPPIGPDFLVALKFDSTRVAQMPVPRPFAEIYVHSLTMSGIHLRGGPVARGGVRWSDRPGDFRTEVLGLMKTQMVKNGVIVPVGSKGGFVLRRRIPDPQQAAREAELQYERFIRALMSLTDDRSGERIVPPARVVRHDGDDPYLVVAPDKGTARFSDVANRVSEGVGFWLGDAFASGGSEGYDHKRQAITARGAWVCICRHFRELRVDVEREPFTVVGIGDMSGDVFGNGMLLARRARLLAAFNHLHVFLDPSPDPEVSWNERKRLFGLRASSWLDYDPAKISEGGGVFDRSAKEIRLSPQARQMLEVDAETLSGEELTRAVLCMSVDLLWNGGIGTYVKATRESHSDVGDRADDAVRVNAPEVRARVVGEGGNLGFTPRARVEFALKGGKINTDAVDNSGGVDLSDREVNFKILLAPACRAGTLSRDRRNQVLSECVGEAVERVLFNSQSQSLCLSLDERRAQEDPESFLRAADFLSREQGLDPELEGLPTPDEVRSRAAAREGPVYTRPELAVLLGHTKLLTRRSLLESDVPDLPVLRELLEGYFPVSMRTRFREEIGKHPLRREITAMVLSNRVVDRAGVAMLPALVESLGVDPAHVIAAYQLSGSILDAPRIRDTLRSTDLPAAARLGGLLRLEQAVGEATHLFLGLELAAPSTADALESWRVNRERLAHGLAAVSLSPQDRAVSVSESLTREGLPEPLAHEIVGMPDLARTLPALPLVERLERPLESVLRAWLRVGEATRLGELLERLEAEGRRGGWDSLAARSLALQLLEVQRQLTEAALSQPDAEVGGFIQARRAPLERISSTVDRIEGEPTLAPVAFLVRQLRRLC
jgi:glutamate dehydrogenase